jgi:succinate dehydrogenase/fumarate reductase flavoprotein subunit
MNQKAVMKTGLNPRTELLPFLHMGHAFIGGVVTDTEGRTPLEGLWAAGEVVSGHYAGDNSWGMLPSCFAMGAIVGRSAAADLNKVRPPREKREADNELQELQKMTKRKGVKPKELQGELKQLFYRYVGPVRSGPALEEGLQKLQQLAGRAEGLSCKTTRDLKEAMETKSMLLLGKALMQAALLRKESRGGHYREDFPQREDSAWLRPVIVSHDEPSSEVKVVAGEKVRYG